VNKIKEKESERERACDRYSVRECEREFEGRERESGLERVSV